MEPETVIKGNRVHYKMIVNMIGIKMSRNDYLESVSPKFFGKFDSDLMCDLRSDFFLFKTLISMDGYDPARFAKAIFGELEFFLGKLSVAVYAGGIKVFLSFDLIIGIVENIGKT